MPPLPLPPYVSEEPDRHGNIRYYYRRYGRRLRLIGEPGTADFNTNVAEAAKQFTARVSLRREMHAPSYVYFVTFGNSRVKIGTCKNVETRMRALRTGIPGKARIYYVTPGGHKLEKFLHGLFAIDRINGEWFQYSQAIRDWIAADERRRQIERGVRTGTEPVSLLIVAQNAMVKKS